MMGPSDELLVEAFVERAQGGVGLISQEQLDRGWEKMKSADPCLLPARRPVVRSWLAGFATAGALAVLAVTAYRAWSPAQAPALHYAVHGVASTDGKAVASLPGERAHLLFSDESRVDLEPSTKLDVDTIDAQGARISLVDGVVDVYVKPRTNTSWVFAAGPFRVSVKGTAFRLGFEAKRACLTLRMDSGAVEVFAPSDRTIAVGAGESLELCAAPPDVQAEAAAPVAQPPAALSPDESPQQLVPPSGKSENPRVPARRSPVRAVERVEPAAPSGPIAWSGLLANGDFASVVADAERRGLSTVISQASAMDLATLADSARYTKRHELGRQVLLAIRTRFLGTDHARDAAFFLGRLAEASHGQPAAALAWYDTYLAEAPRGLYASEALGREMTLLASGSPERARKVARLYLDRFPHGPQTGLARSLLESDPE